MRFVLLISAVLIAAGCGQRPRCTAPEDRTEACISGPVAVYSAMKSVGVAELCASRCSRVQSLDVNAPTRAQADELREALLGVVEITGSAGFAASSEVANPSEVLTSVVRIGSLLPFFFPADWSGDISFPSVVSVGWLRIEGAGWENYNINRIDFPDLRVVSRLEIVSHNAKAVPDFPRLEKIDERLVIGINRLPAFPSMPSLREAPLVEVGQSDLIESIDELNDVRVDRIGLFQNSRLSSCRIDRTIAAMRTLNSELQVSRSFESTVPCQE